MLKALIKKQLMELYGNYLQGKNGKRRSRKGVIGYAVLMIVLMLVLLGAFSAISIGLGLALIPSGNAWLFFSILGLMALVMGVFGDVFSTYSALYHAKDNDFMLSLPIPPSKLLFARMVAVYVTGLLYVTLVFLPAVIVYWVLAESLTLCKILFPVLLLFVIAFLVLALSCILGWVVALISARLKNKSYITVLLSVVLIALYYVVYFRINMLLQNIMQHLDAIAATMQSALYPFYQLGLAADGNPLAMLIFTAMVGVLFAIVYVVLSRSFIRIVTTNRSEKKRVYKATAAKAESVQKALYRKEAKRFTSSATYMLNCGLGLMITVVAAVAAVIKAGAVRDVVSELAQNLPMLAEILPSALTAFMFMMISMNTISTPSVSLEGKQLWILQSLPVEPRDVIAAKLRLHVIVNIVPAAVSAAVIGIVLQIGVIGILLTLAAVAAFTVFTGQLGLMLGLRKPHLTWTNETVPIKQNMNVLIVMFGGWVIAIAMGAGAYLLRNVLAGEILLAAITLVLAVLCLLMQRWLRGSGARIFAAL
ncbi:MAG: hypothetical protein E7472_03020 [Ruminococcaceae bacterium]|nr:hypothetical protein [Oscillospiraceae bacterium]